MTELTDDELLIIWRFNFAKTNKRRFLDIARAAIAADRDLTATLAKPADAPAAVAERPSDEELRDLWSWAAGQDQGPWPTQQHAFARAVLARWGQPPAVTERPSDEELGLIYHDCCRGCEFMDQVGFEDAARAVLARWGHPPAPPAEGEVAELVADLRRAIDGAAAMGWDRSAQAIARAAELLERHAAPVPKLALAPANDYKSRWLEEDGVMKPVINWIHTIPIEDKDIFHCAQSSCWCSPKVDKDNPEIILHQALTSAQDGWVLIGEIEAASEKTDSLASPPPSELIAELIPELRKVAEHLRDCNFRGFSNCVARAAELLERHAAPVPVPVSERLPGPEDCDDKGRCWWWRTDNGDEWWELLHINMDVREYNALCGDARYTHWLPAHALPLPRGGEVE